MVPPLAQLVRDIHLLQRRGHLAAVAVGDIGEQDFVAGRAVQHHGAHHNGEYGGHSRQEQDFYCWEAP